MSLEGGGLLGFFGSGFYQKLSIYLLILSYKLYFSFYSYLLYSLYFCYFYSFSFFYYLGYFLLLSFSLNEYTILVVNWGRTNMKGVGFMKLLLKVDVGRNLREARAVWQILEEKALVIMINN